MLIKKLGVGLIGLALIVNMGARVAQHYQNKQEIITTSEVPYNFPYNITNLQEDKGNSYNNLEYASYALGFSGAALALSGTLSGKRIIIEININIE